MIDFDYRALLQCFVAPFSAIAGFVASRVTNRSNDKKKWQEMIETNLVNMKVEHIKLNEKMTSVQETVLEIKLVCKELNSRLWDQVKNKK